MTYEEFKREVSDMMGSMYSWEEGWESIFLDGYEDHLRHVHESNGKPRAAVFLIETEFLEFRDRKMTRDLFERLKDKLEEETRLNSSSTEIIMNMNYQQIIGMGDRALPFLLTEMKERKGHWHWALKAITRANPVAGKEEKGSMEIVDAAWEDWARENFHDPDAETDE